VFERPDVPVVHNGGLEASDPAPWKPYGRCVPVAYGAASGSRALRVEGASGAEQKLHGLRPGTRYILSAKVRLLTPQQEARLGVKAHGEQEQWTASSSSDFADVRLVFATGARSTTATVYCFVPFQPSAAIFDDISIAETKD
jgi:hypothetical protein